MTPETSRCRHFDEAIEAYVDGELDGDEHARLQRHAASCAACAARVRLAGRIRDELRAMPRPSAPAHVIDAIKARARADGREAGGRVVRLRRRPYWAAAAAAALLVALAVALLRPEPPRPPETDVARAADEARYALAKVAQLTRKAGREAGRGLEPRRLVRPAVDGLVRSLGRTPSDADRSLEGGAES